VTDQNAFPLISFGTFITRKLLLSNQFRHRYFTGDLRPHWHMRMTSSKCVLQQRHLLGYQSEPEP